MFAIANPGIVAAGVERPSKTYADFVAYVNALPTFVANWGSGSFQTTGLYKTTAGSPSGTMWGSSWMSRLTSDSAPCRLIQHGLPSEAVFYDQVANGRLILFDLLTGFSNATGAVNRNGYWSSAYTDFPTVEVRLIRYWDGFRVVDVNPFAGTGPVPFVWPS